MLNALKQNSWWLAMSLAGVSQQGAVGPCAAAIVITTLLKAIAHAIWFSLPQLWRDRLCDEFASSRAKIQTDAKAAAPWRPAANPETVPFQTRLAKSQEHHHAYP